MFNAERLTKEQKLAEFEKKREALLKLSECFVSLRIAISAHCKEKKISLSAFAGRLPRQSYTRMRSFLEGRSALLAGNILDALWDDLNLSELRDTMKACFASILIDRLQAVAVLPREVIDVGCELFRAYYAADLKVTFNEFARNFQPHADIVHHIFLLSQETGWRKLSDESVRVQIQSMILQEVWLNTTREKSADEQEKEKLTAHFQELHSRLLTRFGKKADVARALGRCKTVVSNALTGKSKIENTCEMIASAEKLLSGSSVVRDSSDDLDVANNTRKYAKSVIGERAIHNESFGEDSPSGVRFVVSSKTFRALDAEVDESAIRYAATSIERTRAILNVLMQVRSDETREKIRDRLSVELEELFLTFRHFSVEIPTRFTKLIEDQRSEWYGGSQKHRNKRRE